MKENCLKWIAALLMSASLLSCNTGLGELVDIEAPEIKVSKMVTYDKEGIAVEPETSFVSTIYTRKKVTFSGTAYDNNILKGVHAEIRWLSDDDYHYLKDAVIVNGEWTFDFEFEKEGACWLKFVAEDTKDNVGSKSSKIITLFVDNDPPVIGDAWYINRGSAGNQYNLQTLEALKDIVTGDEELTNSSNINVAQNDSFTICGSLKDATGIADTISISLYGENGNLIKNNISKTPSSTKYAPEFVIDDDTFKGLPDAEEYKTGKHYLQVRYSADDEVKKPGANSVTDGELEMGWFLWWPESDKPRYSVINLKEGTKAMQVNAGESINVTVFDDDALAGEVKLVLDGKEQKIASELINGSDQIKNITIETPKVPQTMTLTITAKDQPRKDENGVIVRPAIELNEQITVHVTDDFVPTLILTSPENNQIPNVDGSDANINFTGITLDKVGCTNLEFVWVPDAVTGDETLKYKKAKEILDGIIDHSVYAPAGSAAYKKSTVNGCTLWSAKLTSAGTEGDFQKHSFNFNLSLMNDFAADKIKNKCFVARVSREDGNYTDTEFKLASDDLKPEIETVYPAGNMAIVDKDVDLVIKFRGTKSSGIAMDTSKYKLSYIAPDKTENVLAGTYDSTEKVYKYTVPKSVLAEYDSNYINPKFRYEVEDVLGNKNSGEYQYIISSLPQIKNVTSSASEKCKLDDEILINVAFTKPVSCGADTYLKLKGIENEVNEIVKTDVVRAYYSSGNGSTTLVFKYKVQSGDKSKELLVWNEPGVGPISGMSEEAVHLTTMLEGDNLQDKRKSNPITINGISPKVLACVIDTDAESATADKLGNKFGGISYLKAGRTITATIRTDKPVTVQGAPKFYLKSKKDSSKELVLSWQSISNGNQTLTFSKKISSGDVNDDLVFSQNEYLGSTYGIIKDEYLNSLVIDAEAGTVDPKINIDTDVPTAPVITKEDLTTTFTGGLFKDSAKFGISSADTKNVTVQYSEDGGSNWEKCTIGDVVTLTKDSQLVAKVTDYAGNVSKYSSIVNVDIESSFPDFAVECVNSDGNYKEGTVLEFKVTFDRAVDIDANSAAYFNLSAESGTITPGAKAVIKAASKNKKNVSEAVFEYTTQAADDFTLKVAKDAFVLSGIKDKYGIVQGDQSLKADYVRADLKCDSIAPTVVSMVPQGDKTTQNNLNAYSDGSHIQITFDEPVNIVRGKIYLRQTSGWAIPPMFTASEFSKVLAAVNGITVNENGKTLTGSQVLYMDGLEDAENLYGALVGPANDRYHGTAQYVGPYKKMTNGIDKDGNPDLSVKYVLDFGVDIWNKNNSTKQNFGKTFEPNWSKDGTTYTYMTYHKDNQKDWVHVITPETVITTDTIRSVLEKAHFHERYMNVNSTYVDVSEDRKTYTLNFPEGVLGESALPLGRQWELVIEKNAFMDDTGNYFGEDSEENQILIQEGSGNTKNDSFMSAGVEKPVIRVNRYSYGLGIKQPTAVNGNAVSEEQIEILNTTGASWRAGTGLTTPSAKVAVKIDCESRAATVRYAMNSRTSSNSSTLTNIAGFGDDRLKSHVSSTTATIPANATTGTTTGSAVTKIVFLAGSEDYTKSCKAYITADATSTGAENSEVAKEGVFQTVVVFNNPQNSGTKSIANAGNGIQAVNIHGTTGTGGVPSIAPFPLRDQPVSSAYMRQTYQIGDQYYWVSYEVLTQGIFSMYAYGRCVAGSVYTNTTGRWYDWSPGYGTMRTGEFTRCDGMHSYTEDF